MEDRYDWHMQIWMPKTLQSMSLHRDAAGNWTCTVVLFDGANGQHGASTHSNPMRAFMHAIEIAQERQKQA